jgi:tetraacyldisaccharide 4'-kinase
MTARYLEKVILGEDRGPVSWLILALLWPPSMIYRVGLCAYLWIYKIGLRKRCKLGVPVISVGNLTFGGTGKTPAVQTLCRMLVERGKRVVVLSRGHGGSARGAVVVSDGERMLADSAEAGDEPVLLARTLPGVPVIVGKDRRESGRLACRQFRPDVIVLDDGLQYWQLHRDLDIIVMDAGKPLGSGFVMPMGDLREPASGLRRAGIILLSSARSLGNAEHDSLIARISKLAPNARVFGCTREPVSFIHVQTGEEHDLTWSKGRGIVAFCGIGKPWSFVEILEALGASVEASIVFADHYRLTQRDIDRIIDEAQTRGVEVVTTEKDVARLSPIRGNSESGPIPNLYALSIKLEIEDSSRFAEYITNRIDGKN